MKAARLKIATGILAFGIGIICTAIWFIYPYSFIVFLIVTMGILALSVWSARIGQKVWSPEVFAWRNPLKPQPIIEEQANCPLHLIHPRFYSFMSIGSSIGSVIKIDVKNVSNKAIHSFFISYYSPEATHKSGMGIQPETCLQPQQSEIIGTTTNGDDDRVTFSVDLVQFVDGDIWLTNLPTENIKPEGVQAGAQAATEYLQEVLEVDGAETVMNVLPNIKRKMALWRFSEEGDFGLFGFDYGIKKVVLSVEYAYQKNGLSGVENFLIKQHQ
jgi:hypothetical protein